MTTQKLIKTIVLTLLLFLLQVNVIAIANIGSKAAPAADTYETSASESFTGEVPAAADQVTPAGETLTGAAPTAEGEATEIPETKHTGRAWFSLASSSTENCTPGILTNLRLAADKINVYTIEPGKVFSFNSVVGERTAEAGYQEGRMIVDDEPVLGIGGGICQLSSTIYDAALGAGLEIVERNPHTVAVSYAAPGRDAMVAYGQSDLKFRNNRERPVKIVVTVTEKSLLVTLFEA